MSTKEATLSVPELAEVARRVGERKTKKGGESMNAQDLDATINAEESRQATVGDKPGKDDGKVARKKKDTTQTATTGQVAKGEKSAETVTEKVEKAKTKKEDRNQFERIVDGDCPHCSKTLAAPISGKGTGKTRVCQNKKCGHKWYYNTEIRTSKCLTCAEEKRKSVAKPVEKPKAETKGKGKKS